MKRLSKRTRLALVTVVFVSAALGVARYFGWIFPSEGPLGNTAGNVGGTNVEAGSTVAVLYQLPAERLEDPVKLLDVELVGHGSDLRVVDARVIPCRPVDESCIPGFSAPWPPPNDSLEPLTGYVLTNGGNSHVAIAVRIPADADSIYRIRGAILEYSQGWRRFRTELGPRYRLHVE